MNSTLPWLTPLVGWASRKLPFLLPAFAAAAVTASLLDSDSTGVELNLLVWFTWGLTAIPLYVPSSLILLGVARLLWSRTAIASSSLVSVVAIAVVAPFAMDLPLAAVAAMLNPATAPNLALPWVAVAGKTASVAAFEVVLPVAFGALVALHERGSRPIEGPPRHR